jgi:hypothetical protein
MFCSLATIRTGGISLATQLLRISLLQKDLLYLFRRLAIVFCVWQK